MNKEQLLQQMEAVVADVMKNYQSDFFQYDKPRIASPEFKFPAIWIVGESHAHRLELGNYKDLFFEAESVRYNYLREPNPYKYFLNESYFAKDKWFLITENGLQSINREQAKAAIEDYVTPAVKAWEEENGPIPRLTKVPVKFKGITFNELKALIADCRAHGDDSLLECFKRRQTSCRVAANQYAVITWHKSWNEFTFCEYVNDEEGLEGHIVFHGWPETGYQTNGAIQIDPRYGWSSHT